MISTRQQVITMNELQLINKNGVFYADSRQVAEMINKRHTDLLRDIDRYISVLGQNAKLRSDDFFAKSSYRAGTGKEYLCYLITRKGCHMIAHKMTGDKGILFTAEYVTRFDEMENRLKGDPIKQLDIMEKQIAIMRQYGQQLVEHSGQIISLNNAVNEVKNTIKGIKELEDLNSTNWRLKSRLVINRIAANYPALDDTNVYSAVRCEFYCRLEAEARCNLGRRLTNRKMRAKAAGASKSDLDKMNRMMIIDEDVRLINCAIAVLKKMAIEYGAID